MRFVFLLLLWFLSIWRFPAYTQSIHLRGFTDVAAQDELIWEKRLKELPESDAFRKHLQMLTVRPHRAGTPGSQQVIRYLTKTMEAAGMKVDTYHYDIYIPPEPGISRVEIIQPIRLPLNQQEYILEGDPFSADVMVSQGWNAFSGSGTAIGEVVYAHYGTREDFERLSELGVSVKGKIVIARYGRNFRGYKAKYAQAAGAIGLIIYNDPRDNGYVRGLTYPEGPFANSSTIQRGSLLTLDYEGDPLTPFEPALSGNLASRLDPDEVEDLHDIPVLPLPYGSAKEILSRMTGAAVPAKWQGGLPFTYRLAGGENLKIRLEVEQPKELVRVSNVVGKIEGADFPDEWIILGCHHDAWDFGAVDPNSGTAALLVLAETLGQLQSEGFRPRRSILIGHWDAEEYGIIGSTEWVEQFRAELGAGAVAYMNADGAISGTRFWASASPSLKKPLLEATAEVGYPVGPLTVYDHWASRNSKAIPEPGNLGGGSDHVGFYTHIGVPAMSAGFSGSNGIYHSVYDNFSWYQKFGDTAFVHGPTLARLYGIVALRMANADVLPYGLAQYGTDLQVHLKALQNEIQEYAPGFTLGELLDASARLKQAGIKLEMQIDRRLRAGRKPLSAGKLEGINKGLIALEKSFIDVEGMEFGSWYRSLYAAPDPYSGYAAWMLPGLKYVASARNTDRLDYWKGRYLNAIQNLQRKMELLARSLR